MKVISTLLKPRLLLPPPQAGLLTATSSSGIPTSTAVAEPETSKIEELFQTVFSSSSLKDKAKALATLATHAERNELRDTRLIPAIVLCAQSREPELKREGLNSLGKAIKIISLYDSELVPFFAEDLKNTKSLEPLYALRIILSRGPIHYPGLISLVGSFFKEASGLHSEAVALGIISAYLSQKQLPTNSSVNDLMEIAVLPNGRLYPPRSQFLIGGTIYTVERYEDEILKNHFPELVSLLLISDNGVIFSTADIRSEALCRLAEMLESHLTDSFNLRDFLYRQSGSNIDACRVNVTACIGNIVTKQHVIDKKLFCVLKNSLKDNSTQVRANALEAMRLLAGKHTKFALEVRNFFIEHIKEEESNEVKTQAILGMIELFEKGHSLDFISAKIIVDCVQDPQTADEVKAFALLAIAVYLSKCNIENPDLDALLLSHANSFNLSIRANAIFAIANRVKWDNNPPLLASLLKGVEDFSEEVQAYSFLGIRNYLENNTIDNVELLKIVRENLLSENEFIKTNCLYIFGRMICYGLVNNVSESDLNKLLSSPSASSYDISKAATYALSEVVNRDTSIVKSEEQLDKIELLCKIFGLCIPSEDDLYDRRVNSAMIKLKQNFQIWRNERVIGTDPSIKDLIRLSDKYSDLENLLEQVAIKLNQLYQLLQYEIEKNRVVEDENLFLIYTLQEERELRTKLEEQIRSISLELEKAKISPDNPELRLVSNMITWGAVRIARAALCLGDCNACFILVRDVLISAPIVTLIERNVMSELKKLKAASSQHIDQTNKMVKVE